MKSILITAFGLLAVSSAYCVDPKNLTKQEFLVYIGEIAHQMKTSKEFPELAADKVHEVATFGLPGHEFKKDELVIYETPSHTYTYGILSLPLIFYGEVKGWSVQTPDRRVIEREPNQIGKLKTQPEFKEGWHELLPASGSGSDASDVSAITG